MDAIRHVVTRWWIPLGVTVAVAVATSRPTDDDPDEICARFYIEDLEAPLEIQMRSIMSSIALISDQLYRSLDEERDPIVRELRARAIATNQMRWGSWVRGCN
jgi:hypothetical protein